MATTGSPLTPTGSLLASATGLAIGAVTQGNGSPANVFSWSGSQLGALATYSLTAGTS